jgi:P-type E1-E2 ATPase
MTIGIIYAVEKLQNKQIFCTSQNNIVKGGRVEHVCFDKTGTLTKNQMDFKFFYINGVSYG